VEDHLFSQNIEASSIDQDSSSLGEKELRRQLHERGKHREKPKIESHHELLGNIGNRMAAGERRLCKNKSFKTRSQYRFLCLI